MAKQVKLGELNIGDLFYLEKDSNYDKEVFPHQMLYILVDKHLCRMGILEFMSITVYDIAGVEIAYFKLSDNVIKIEEDSEIIELGIELCKVKKLKELSVEFPKLLKKEEQIEKLNKQIAKLSSSVFSKKDFLFKSYYHTEDSVVCYDINTGKAYKKKKENV